MLFPRLRCVRLAHHRSLSLTLLLALPSMAMAEPTSAQTPLSQQQQVHFQIPAQSLASALIVFSQRSGWQVSEVFILFE